MIILLSYTFASHKKKLISLYGFDKNMTEATSVVYAPRLQRMVCSYTSCEMSITCVLND